MPIKPKLEEPTWARVGGAVKDAFADQTKLGIAKNTITGMPRAAVKMVKAVKNRLMTEDPLTKQAIAEMNKRFPGGWAQSSYNMSEVMRIRKQLKKKQKGQ